MKRDLGLLIDLNGEQKLPIFLYKYIMIIVPKKVLVTLDVYYYMPKHQHLINEFLWQTDDVYPKFDRVNSFMSFWKSSINAVISEVVMAYCDQGKWTKVDFESVIK